MPETVNSLTLQFLEWLASRPRTYAEVMGAWRSSCPRLTIWEDAIEDDLIRIENGGTPDQSEVTLTPRGKALLDSHGSHA